MYKFVVYRIKKDDRSESSEEEENAQLKPEAEPLLTEVNGSANGLAKAVYENGSL